MAQSWRQQARHGSEYRNSKPVVTWALADAMRKAVGSALDVPHRRRRAHVGARPGTNAARDRASPSRPPVLAAPSPARCPDLRCRDAVVRLATHPDGPDVVVLVGGPLGRRPGVLGGLAGDLREPYLRSPIEQGEGCICPVWLGASAPGGGGHQADGVRATSRSGSPASRSRRGSPRRTSCGRLGSARRTSTCRFACVGRWTGSSARAGHPRPVCHSPLLPGVPPEARAETAQISPSRVIRRSSGTSSPCSAIGRTLSRPGR